ncbi:MAG: beta-N-acetylhexosaminidase [Fimbriimonadaceae bacterium]|nr:beta-N-acetylhexosaminidase [Fimbriimonadaceae bacterium]
MRYREVLGSEQVHMVWIAMLVITSPLIRPALLPEPVSVRWQTGHFALLPGAPLAATGAAAGVARLARAQLGLTGAAPRSGTAPGVSLRLDPRLASLGQEGYRLRVDRSGVVVRSAGLEGLFYGVQTLRQLLPPEAFGGKGAPRGGWKLPCVAIEDRPRFAWRGAHLDVARHFMPKWFLLRFVDALAMHKMNVLHLHLTDDQGWRIQIERYPKLVSVGSHRKDTQTNDRPDEYSGKPHSGHYTQAELREIVAYARARFVTVLPEIEMPGHSQAAIAAYPELGNTGRPLEVATGWGVHEDVLNVEDGTIRFYENVLDEVIAIFPSKYVHIGGDEAPKKQWRESAAAQAKMRALGLKDEDELQSWFVRQIGAHLRRRGKRLIGWDEILEGGLAEEATVMSWRGEEGGLAAVRAGHDAIMSPYEWTYLDQRQTNDPALELPRGWGHLSLARIWSYEPMPAGLTPEETKRVLGAQTALWTEVIPDPATAEKQLFPRLCAFAEVVWSPRRSRLYERERPRMVAHVARLDAMRIARHPVDPVQTASDRASVGARS